MGWVVPQVGSGRVGFDRFGSQCFKDRRVGSGSVFVNIYYILYIYISFWGLGNLANYCGSCRIGSGQYIFINDGSGRVGSSCCGSDRSGKMDPRATLAFMYSKL